MNVNEDEFLALHVIELDLETRRRFDGSYHRVDDKGGSQTNWHVALLSCL
jgi:hypothetical protein